MMSKSKKRIVIPLSLLFALSLIVGAFAAVLHGKSVLVARAAEDEYNTVKAGTYYVSPDGNDNNDGKTLKTAWKSISFAAYMMGNKGYGVIDTILVADGVYYETGEIKPNTIIGTKEKPATIKSINKWGAKIVSSSPYHGVYICNCQYFTFDGFMVDFTAEKNHHFGICAFPDERGGPSNHITVRNCIVTNAPSSGIQINGTDNVIIENNYVYKNALTEDGNNGSGISVYEPMHCPDNLADADNDWGIVIRNNYIWQNNCLHNCPGFNFPTDGNGIIIDDYRWTQNGNKHPYTKKTLVENNLVFDNGGRGIHVFISNDVTIRNNTVYQNGWNVMQYNAYGNGINLEQGMRNEVYNNVVYTLNKIPSSAINDSCGDTVYKNNVVVGSVKINGLNEFPANATGNRIVSEVEAESVGLYNPANDLIFLNFSPKEGSMLLNAGDATNAAATDITGAARDLSDGVTIGAYETGSEAFGIPTAFFDKYQSADIISSFRTPSKFTDKVGNPSNMYDPVKIAADTMVASLFEANNTLACKSVSVYLKKVEGKFNIAVYSDNNGVFGLKLSETGLLDGVNEEKQYTYDLKKTVNVAAGQKIWIAMYVEGGENTYICAYDVPSAAKVAFMDVTESAPLTISNGVISNMLLSVNLNGTAANSGAPAEKSGCGGTVDAVSSVFGAVAVFLTAALCCMRKRSSRRE